MFRITRGHQVQHIHLPLPIIRAPLDAEDDAPAEGVAPAPGDSPAPAAPNQAAQESADG